MAAGPISPKETPPAGAAAQRELVAGEKAAEFALAQLAYGESPHVGLIGDTGTGKTTAARELIKLYLKKSPGSVFIVDDKELRARYEGEERRDRRDLRDHPVAGRVVIFRGEPSKAIMANAEEVAELAWRRVARGKKTLLVLDELVSGREDLSKNAQWRKGITYVPRSFTAGRQPGVGTIWGAQSPQLVPRDPFEESGCILCFRLAGLGLDNLRSRNYLAGGAEEVIPTLHGPPKDPPHLRGDFVLLVRGQPWDGNVYKFQGPA